MMTLIVEDEVTSLRILESYLEDYSEVVYALDADSAFEMFLEAHEENEPFDLLCVDINMPDASGLELLTEIREYEESNGIVASDCVKVFIVTGDNTPQKIFDSMSKGCSAYFTKPVDRSKFIEELKKIAD